MCMAINHDTIIERHICTSEWAVSNLLPSKGAGPRIPREALSSSRAGRRCGRMCSEMTPYSGNGNGTYPHCHFRNKMPFLSTSVRTQYVVSGRREGAFHCRLGPKADHIRKNTVAQKIPRVRSSECELHRARNVRVRLGFVALPFPSRALFDEIPGGYSIRRAVTTSPTKCRKRCQN